MFQTAIRNDMDISIALVQARKLARNAGFKDSGVAMIGTSVSELGRNIVKYAGYGEITVRAFQRPGAQGIEILAQDNGPGISDVSAAMQDHFSTSGTLGLGLPGVRRMMDEFDLDSGPAKGTRVTVRKFL